jgi:indolepyruvate ferredoxin oxidoreductase
MTSSNPFRASTEGPVMDITLADKYSLDGRQALLGGRQALVRLPIVQRALDRRAGLNTAGFISGYRGSPLGGYDMELWKAAATLKANDIVFEPGLNEDLAMTALAGTQQLDFIPGARVDGVFGLWYGKGPGVDRSGDAIKHANLQGTAPAGGILLIFGDDHAGKSSTTAHQSDLTLASWEVPVLYPSSVAELLQMGLAGIAMSRYSGLVVALKLVNETAEATAVVDLDHLPEFAKPELPAPEGGIHIRPEMHAVQQRDVRLLRYKLPRAQAFARANGIDRIAFGSAAARFVIATAGKAYADTIAALGMLGVDEAVADALGIAVYKIGLLFPLEPLALRGATAQAAEVFFVEEKRAHAELQAKALFYDQPRPPRVSGKFTPDGVTLLPADLPLDATLVAAAIAARLAANFADLETRSPALAATIARIRQQQARQLPATKSILRRPEFCPGCPHNTSTRVPQGSFGATGIGCHSMVIFHPERKPVPMLQMGAEGANWIGIAPFTTTRHIFQNLGDGTYSHSGSLAIRAAVQAGVNITYKILFNDAVAMTGGQPVEGRLTVTRIVDQVRAEGVSRVVVLSEQPERFTGIEPLPTGTELHHRDDLDEIQEALRNERGVTVLIYDQTCAAEKRRRRKTQRYPDPDRRLFINELICEGCGDCSTQSNCVAIQPLESELGRKRKIDQSACNKDFSCVKGFCPSFVSVEGARPKRAPTINLSAAVDLPQPRVPPIGDGFDMVVAGVGGTGVVTIGALLGMAARIEGLGAQLFDMTGLSQKGGQVFGHVRLRSDRGFVAPARVGAGEANLVLACDLIAAVQAEVLDTVAPGKTLVVANSDTSATAEFQSHRDFAVSQTVLVDRIRDRSGRAPELIAAAGLSKDLLGDSISANVLMLGYAWQRGAIPLSLQSIERAIELNGTAVQANLKAFAAGRMATIRQSASGERPLTLDEFIERRELDLRKYWNDGYARRYFELVAAARAAAASITGGEAFVWAVARGAYKLMAYKDEYEVARLYSDGRFRSALAREFDDVRTLRFHLAPPLLSRTDARSGRPRKISVGSWILPVFGLMGRLKVLRETVLDPFSWTTERKLERTLRDTYLSSMRRHCETLHADNLAEATSLALAPLDVRGFGPVKRPAAEELLRRLIQTAARA